MKWMHYEEVISVIVMFHLPNLSRDLNYILCLGSALEVVIQVWMFIGLIYNPCLKCNLLKFLETDNCTGKCVHDTKY
jgi:hypothetical protein